MSSGHPHGDWGTASIDELERVKANEAVKSRLDQLRVAKIDNEHDIPYLAGYSVDGTTIYFDRHLPEVLALSFDGARYSIRVRDFVRLHEEMEKALIDGLGWGYNRSHRVANMAEKVGVLEAGIQWRPYREVLEPYIKADQHERIKRVPFDLDMTPYKAAPVNKKLLKVMQEAMGEDKLDKDDETVQYSDDRGRPGRHCGPDADWPDHYCSMYGDHDCSAVAGHIDPHGGCDLFEEAKN